jgi:hypothetical protein
VTTVCTPLNARHAHDIARNRGATSTEVSVDLKSDSWNVRVGTRSSSNMRRSGCSITTKTADAAAMSSIVKRQSFHSVTSGPNAPASSNPAGTAVCLIENTRGR